MQFQWGRNIALNTTALFIAVPPGVSESVKRRPSGILNFNSFYDTNILIQVPLNERLRFYSGMGLIVLDVNIFYMYTVAPLLAQMLPLFNIVFSYP